MTNPEIRVIRRILPPQTFIPTHENPEGGILESLRTRGAEVVNAGTHRLWALPATAPHHPTCRHTVNWVVRMEEGKIRPWEEKSWQEVAEDGCFLMLVEEYINRKQ
jgi:hypothetical protein